MKLSCRIIPFLFILVGVIEAIWGLGQLYRVVPSRHGVYLLTGSFYNPGPYTGFLAMIVPVAVYEWLRRRKEPNAVLGHMAWATMLLMGCLIPCGMSRTAWVSVTVGVGYVLAMYARTWITSWSAKHRRMLCAILATVGIGLMVAVWAAYGMKKDSADGRLLMWKVAAQAVMEQPFEGQGWDKVAGTYGQAQEDYFASGQATATEIWVAGAPEYVFNEYLQVALAWGVPVLLLGWGVMAFAGYTAHRNEEYGLVGALLSLGVFAFASYPLQFPQFVVMGILLVAACATTGTSQRKIYAAGVWLLAVAGVALYGSYYLERHKAVHRWSGSRIHYHMEDYAQTVEAYAPLLEEMKWSPHYLFEYGHALHKLGQYEQSDSILMEAVLCSSDPMPLNIIGKNRQALQKYEEAEEWFVRSTHRLPNRLYPYYLLAKLYSEPTFYHPVKCREVIELALNMEPKVPSDAIEDMKRELRTIKEKLQ